MAHVEDRCFMVVVGDRARTPRHGWGLRWRPGYLGASPRKWPSITVDPNKTRGFSDAAATA